MDDSILPRSPTGAPLHPMRWIETTPRAAEMVDLPPAELTQRCSSIITSVISRKAVSTAGRGTKSRIRSRIPLEKSLAIAAARFWQSDGDVAILKPRHLPSLMACGTHVGLDVLGSRTFCYVDFSGVADLRFPYGDMIDGAYLWANAGRNVLAVTLTAQGRQGRPMTEYPLSVPDSVYVSSSPQSGNTILAELLHGYRESLRHFERKDHHHAQWMHDAQEKVAEAFDLLARSMQLIHDGQLALRSYLR